MNQGAYAARNTGLSAATGDLVMVHDSDDWSHPQRIELQVTALRRNPSAVAVKSFWVRVGPQLEVIGPWIPKGTLFDLNFSSLLFRRELVERVGAWDDVMVGGDPEFYSRIQAAYGKDAVIKLPKDHLLALALTREGSLTRSKNTHLRTFDFGLRWNYADSYLSWHSRLAQTPRLAEALKVGRQFPVPLGNRVRVKSQRSYDVLVVSDFALDDERSIEVLRSLDLFGKQGKRVAVFHWRSYQLPSRAPLSQRLYEICVSYDFDILIRAIQSQLTM